MSRNRKKAQKEQIAELTAENRFLRGSRRGESFASVCNNLIKWGGAVGISFFIFKTIETLAGKETEAAIGIAILGDVNVSVALSWTLTTLAIGYGLRQRHLRKRTIHRFGGHVKDTETAIDPKRTSSGLTPTGDTHPHDK